jgi:serine/threonine protein kinase/tetratricopeptide (TPR) repeat protein
VADATIDIKIPGHRILRQIGSGGMANVYVAFQESMEREVALKVMHPSLGLTDASFSERFLREAKIVAKLSHPHINAVYDVAVAGSYHYFTMEYLPGGDLKSRIRNGMSPRTALAIVRQIAAALAFAHSKGYVHRDVKPENVLFRDNNTAVLTDFGIAKTNDNSMTATGAIVGTPYYMSPEQAMGRPIDKRSDLYSLGVMLFEMLTGKVPYTGDSAIAIGIKHIKDPVPKLLPASLQTHQPLLDKFMAKNPAQRFQNGDEAINAIDAFASGANATSATGAKAMARTVVLTPDDTQKIATGAGKRRGLIVATALLIPLVVGASYFALRKPSVPISSTTVAAPVATPTTEAPSTSADADARAAQIAQLFAQAQDAAKAGKYLEPDDTAAVPTLNRVLALEPANARALRALNEIAGQFIAQAEHAMEAKNFDQAENFLKKAEATDPNHPMLFSRRLALADLRQKQLGATSSARAERKVPAPNAAHAEPARAEIRKPTVATVEDAQARLAREREQKLLDLTSRFRALLAPETLSAARAGLAQDLLTEATRLAPDDNRVRLLSKQLADVFFKLASAKAAEKEYEQANALIQRGLDLQPDHRQLLAMQKEIATQTRAPQKDAPEKKPGKPQVFGSF